MCHLALIGKPSALNCANIHVVIIIDRTNFLLISIYVYICRVYFSLSSYNGYLEPSFVESINEHWMHFNPPSEWEHYTLAIILSCIMIVGLTGNALVICMCMRYRSQSYFIAHNQKIIICLSIYSEDFLHMKKQHQQHIHISNCVAMKTIHYKVYKWWVS